MLKRFHIIVDESRRQEIYDSLEQFSSVELKGFEHRTNQVILDYQTFAPDHQKLESLRTEIQNAIAGIGILGDWDPRQDTVSPDSMESCSSLSSAPPAAQPLEPSLSE